MSEPAPPGGGGGDRGGGGGGGNRRRRRRGRGGGGGGRDPQQQGAAPPGGPRAQEPRAQEPRAQEPRRDGRPPERDRGQRREGRGPEREREPRRDGRGPEREREPRREGRAPEREREPRREGRAPEREPRREPPRAAAAMSAPLYAPTADMDSGWGDAPPHAAEPAPVEIARTPTPPRPPEPRDPDGEDVFAGDELAVPPGAVTNVAGIKFRPAGTIYEFDAEDKHYARGERVVVESERGQVVGIVAVASRRMPMLEPLRRIVRRAVAADESGRERNAGKEREAYVFCKQRIRERRLPMKLVRVEYPLASGRVLFYFASEERVDFRDLVKDLAARVHARIEMRQIGARDEAKMVGGIGSCGRELCCSTFLPAFVPVSIKMAKDQGLVLNPSKVSGQCGRLKCCLVYEHDLYKEMKKGLPKVGKRVTTPAGPGKVVELDVLRQRVRVWFDEGGSEVFPPNVLQLVNQPGAPQPKSDDEQAE